jgi:formate dehydrogenase iron-sulfur subunit
MTNLHMDPIRTNQSHSAIGSPRTTAFLTDSTLCIGCKACEVACKEWNGLERT